MTGWNCGRAEAHPRHEEKPAGSEWHVMCDGGEHTPRRDAVEYIVDLLVTVQSEFGTYDSDRPELVEHLASLGITDAELDAWGVRRV